MKKILILTASAMTLAAATPALAGAGDPTCDSANAKWMSEAAIAAKATEKGYKVRSIKTEKGCYEVYGVSKSGQRAEIFFHPVSGEIVKIKAKS
jgi:hypothetical protein